jgi:adenine-specific DNA-methyltransferase
MPASRQKSLGAYYTPDVVVRSLVRWAVRDESDRLLDPCCGDGRFLLEHPHAVGVENDPTAASIVHQRSPGCLLHEGEFFSWASQTQERFDCAAGNPPFIRYQRFAGTVRDDAIQLCRRHGAYFSSLTSSWAPFLVATGALLARGGRLAFVVPAEIGYATYARPLIEHLCRSFASVQVVAVREKLFPALSEDCWLLYCEGKGGSTQRIRMTTLDRFAYSARPPHSTRDVSLDEWRLWNCRLRPFLLPSDAREFYANCAAEKETVRLCDVAKVHIGYVTGDNSFFHLRPSEARFWGIPARHLQVAVRNGRALRSASISNQVVAGWRRNDEPVLLLRLQKGETLPPAVRDYLDSPAGAKARQSYKCRSREPWYVVPDVTVPDGFLSYMCGNGPSLVANEARCVGTNSVHVVHLTGGVGMASLRNSWDSPLTRLSCEIEGRALGGGMLKLEPREAGRILFSRRATTGRVELALLESAIETMRKWRHHAT